MIKRVCFILLVATVVLFGCSSKKEQEYRSSLENVTENMFNNVVNAETIINNYSNAWGKTIKARGSLSVDEVSSMTGLDNSDVKDHFPLNSAGHIAEDFSIIISSLKSYYESSGALSEIKDNSSEIKDQLSDLKDPPEDYKETYNEVLDLYGLHEEFASMAINPSGSLQDFNERATQLSQDIVSKYKKIEVIMPDEK